MRTAGPSSTMLDDDIFKRYEILVGVADRAFDEIKKDYPGYVKCHLGCSDCCNAVFGLFLVEAVYLGQHFARLAEKEKQETIGRADAFKRSLDKIGCQGTKGEKKSMIGAFDLSKERVRCPLLNREEACVLHSARPITCRVYGIPTAIHGTAHVCPDSTFEQDKTYPTFDLDAAYKALYLLSRQLLERVGNKNAERASYLVSIAEAVKNSPEELLGGRPD